MEMNIFCPQSIEAQYELEEIADLKLQIITPQQSTPIIAMKQDQLLGAYNLTSEYYKISWQDTMNLLTITEIEDLDAIKKDKDYTGKEIFSNLIPKKINLLKGPIDKPKILVKNGIIKEGLLDENSLGVKKSNTLIQLVWDEYGVEPTRKFLDNITRLVNNYNMYHGFSVGIGDLELPEIMYHQMKQIFDTKKLEIQHEITEIENNPDMLTEELFEAAVNQKLANIRDDISKIIMSNIKKDNNIKIMIESGSKGKAINFAQMAGCVGQQDFHGSRILKNYNGRTLPYFFKNDDCAEARGFIENSFIKGLNLPEFIFHHLSSREGLIDQTVRSVTPDTKIMILENSKPKVVEIGPWIDSHLEEIYKINPNLVEHDKNNFELLKVNNIIIPTLDENGKVTWGDVTAITRHDPGMQLFEIVTRGGRKVIVPESKSLLIWNDKTEKFEEKLTPDVVVGDRVPVTMNLCEPPVINYSVNITENDKFILNRTNGELTGLFLANEFNNNDSKILYEFLDKNTKNSKVNEKQIPDFAFNASEEYIIGLLNAYISKNYNTDESEIIISSSSINLLYGISMLLNRFGIFADLDTYNDNNILKISNKWFDKLKYKIGLSINNDNNINLDYKEQEDVVLDKIIEINPIEVSKYKKLYDLTIPSTLNFIIFNGLGCRDTADSGYIQRKLIKSTEDFMVNYDGTVRNAVGRIQQFIYGDCGVDTVKQYEYRFKMMEMSNSEINDKFIFNKEELKKVKNFTEKDNEVYYNNLLEMRDKLRTTQIKATVNNIVLETSYMLPINIYRIIDNIRNDPKLQSKDILYDAKYIITTILNILDNKNTKLYCMTEEEMNNPNSVKFRDDYTAKTALRYALFESLSPKLCIYNYKLNKEQLDNIASEMIKSFNKSIVEPGEMVGIIAAQSLGEPVTQMMLNSLDWTEEILVHDSKNNTDIVLPIGKFIDELIENNKDKVTNPDDNLDAEMKNIYYLDTKNHNYQIKSVDENGKISWKQIEAITKHLPINKDGSDTLIKVTTRTGKSVIATKGKSFLTQKDNKIVAIRGDEIIVGDYLPIAREYLDNKYLNSNFIEVIPSVKLNSTDKKTFNKNELREILENTSNDNDKQIINQLLNSDVFMDKIVSIEEVKPTKTYVYDFTVEDTKTFIIANGLCCMDSFHASGIGGMDIGVDRIKEVFSLSKNPKKPYMMIYMDKEHQKNKDFANKIASHIKFITIKDLRTNIEIYYDENPYDKDGFMEKDNVFNIFYSYQSNKQCCLNSIDGLPWLMRIEFDKEKLLNKEVTLLDIKSKFCFAWEKRYQDTKSLKREKRQILEKITQIAVLSNTDNDDKPVIHIRFDLTNYNSSTIIDFMDMFVDNFKLKGISDIDDILFGGKAKEERFISFDNPDKVLEKNNEYVIYTKGINMDEIRNIIGVDLNRTYCNDIITIYEMFGIEAARNLIIRQIISVLSENGSRLNYQHISIFGDLMTNMGNLTSIDRHGLNKLDTDPLSRASFEKTVDQLITASVFNEVDYMKSVSSRIMAGLCIKGGTGLCNLVLDKDLLENSEYTTDIGQLYKKTFEDITANQQIDEINEEVFIPTL